MHAVTTQVGESQNLLIAETPGWEFGQFFLETAPVSIPVAIAGGAVDDTVGLGAAVFFL